VSADGRSYALGISVAGRTWFLSRAANFGNLMRTSDPDSARTWPTVAELELWVDALPEGAKVQIADRPLTIVPVLVTVGRPVGTLTLKTVDAPDPGVDPTRPKPDPGPPRLFKEP
jgi:hypothetical protein